jgi:hypothetical protein
MSEATRAVSCEKEMTMKMKMMGKVSTTLMPTSPSLTYEYESNR